MKKSSLSLVAIVGLLLSFLSIVEARQVVIRSDVHYSVTNYSTGAGPSGLWLANIRGQKTWRDLVVANKDANTVTVRLCRDAGNFNTNATSYAVDLQPVAVTSVDLNRDRYDEVITANFGTNTISVLRNMANNTLATATNYVVGSIPNPGPIALATGDATGDGRQDVFVANLNENSVTVLTNAGSTSLATRSNIVVGTGPIAIAFFDFNSDGAGDVVTANTNGTITVLQGDGTGGFTLYTNLTLFSGGDPQPAAIGAIDFNKDGRIDIVTANYSSNSISVLTNSGTSFELATNYDVGTGPRALALRDFNNDGNWDVAVANEGSSNVHILLGQGDATFTLGAVTTVGANPLAIAASNFNSDNMSDLAVACYADNVASILLYDLPIVYNDYVSAFEDSAKTFSVTAQSLNGTLAYTVLASPTHGSLTGSGPSYTYTPDTNYYGADSFTFKVNDGSNDSATATNTLNVLAVNDAPSFELSTNLVQATKFSMTLLSNFVSSYSAGPANESAQKVTYLTTSLSVSNIFLNRPAIRADGTLTFRPSTNNFGTSVVTIVAQDTGGRTYGGSNKSPAQTFTIENAGPNPFPSLRGTYNGLFANAGATAPASAGAFSFVLTTVGSYNGVLYLGSAKRYFSGQFDTSGNTQSVIVTATETYTLTLHLDGNAEQVTGTVQGSNWTSDLLGDRMVFDATSNPAPAAGRYTMVIPGTTGSTDYPNGDSFGLLTILSSGRVSFRGTLADGAIVSASSSISQSGQIPFFSTLYGGYGVLSGWIVVTNESQNSLAGSIGWSTGEYYSAGWETNVAVVGSTYTLPASGENILSLTNVLVTLRDGGLTTDLTQNGVLHPNNTITFSSNPNKMAIVFSASLGSFGGSFRHPVTQQTVSIKGTVLQQQNKAVGFFNHNGVSGHIEITAP